MSSYWVNDGNAAMLTDLYELTMLESYFAHGMNDIAVFDLFVRRLPKTRNYLVACGPGRCPSLPGNILVFNGASVVPEILESVLRKIHRLSWTPALHWRCLCRSGRHGRVRE